MFIKPNRGENDFSQQTQEQREGEKTPGERCWWPVYFLSESHHSLTASKGDPAGIFGGFSTPVWGHQESTGDCEGDDAHDDEEKCGDPLWGQPGRNTGSVSSVDGLTLPD